MLTTLAALALLAPSAQAVELTPTDDVWVYPHASDMKDAYLRVWGAGGLSVAPNALEASVFSYSYLRFETKDVPTGKVVEAKLTLWHVADPAFSAEASKAAPMEARPVAGKFSEKTWNYDDGVAKGPAAGKEAVFGNAALSGWPAGAPFKFEIDLLSGKGGFDAYLQSARADGAFGLALTSAMDAENRAVYKVYSKDAEAKYRPMLRLVLAN
jgi:hypothetical protein